jgi:FAD/FMN-containing dehydrogenase
LCDDGIVIDLSVMKGIFVDPQLRTVRVQAGATLGDVDRETSMHALAVPTGVVSETGIAGLTLGGGVGWLVRKYGLTCDNVLCCEVVTAEGEVVTASNGIVRPSFTERIRSRPCWAASLLMHVIRLPPCFATIVISWQRRRMN